MGLMLMGQTIRRVIVLGRWLVLFHPYLRGRTLPAVADRAFPAGAPLAVTAPPA